MINSRSETAAIQTPQWPKNSTKTHTTHSPTHSPLGLKNSHGKQAPNAKSTSLHRENTHTSSRKNTAASFHQKMIKRGQFIFSIR
jgi:hypothetical protein